MVKCGKMNLCRFSGSKLRKYLNLQVFFYFDIRKSTANPHQLMAVRKNRYIKSALKVAKSTERNYTLVKVVDPEGSGAAFEARSGEMSLLTGGPYNQSYENN